MKRTLFAWRAVVVLALAGVALMGVPTAGADEPGWRMIAGGTGACAGPEGPYSGTTSITVYVRGVFPDDIFNTKDNPDPPNPPLSAMPDLQRYIDRVDIAVDCLDPAENQWLLKDGTLVRGLVLPGVDKTLYGPELAKLGIRFKYSDLAGLGSLGSPAGPGPYDFVIEP